MNRTPYSTSNNSSAMNSNNNGGTGLTRVCGLWKGQTKDGKTYLSGSLGNVRVLVFPNGFKKEGSNEPDFIVSVAPNQPKDKPAAQQQQQPADEFGGF